MPRLLETANAGIRKDIVPVLLACHQRRIGRPEIAGDYRATEKRASRSDAFCSPRSEYFGVVRSPFRTQRLEPKNADGFNLRDLTSCVDGGPGSAWVRPKISSSDAVSNACWRKGRGEHLIAA